MPFRSMATLESWLEEFQQLTPPGVEAATWQAELKELADRLTETCRAVDPTSTEQAIKKAHAADVVEGEEHAAVQVIHTAQSTAEADAFAEGLTD